MLFGKIRFDLENFSKYTPVLPLGICEKASRLDCPRQVS